MSFPSLSAVLFTSEDWWSALTPSLQSLPPVSAAQEVGVAGRLKLQASRLAEEASRLEGVFSHCDGSGRGPENVPGHLASCVLEVLVVHLPRHQAQHGEQQHQHLIEIEGTVSCER